MIERIPNPFKEEWDNFDLEDFKEGICSMIDALAQISDEEDQHDILDAIDDEISYYSILIKFKDGDTVEAVKASNLSRAKLLEIGLTSEEIDNMDPDAYFPLTPMISRILLDERPKKKGDTGNLKGWKI